MAYSPYPVSSTQRKVNWFLRFLVIVVCVPILVIVGVSLEHDISSSLNVGLPAAATATINYVDSTSYLIFELLGFSIIAIVVALIMAGFFGRSDDSQY